MPSSPILVGTSSFKKRFREKAFFVDKTEFIQEFIGGPEVSVILRPRRFGKSTNLSLLESFLSIYSELDDFDDFIIGNDSAFCKLHFKQYPVIHLSFKDCEGETWESMRKKVWGVLRQVVLDHSRRTELDLRMGKGVDFNDENPPQDFETIIFRLTVALNEKYNQGVVVLIDEYDAPLNHAFRHGYYNKASMFFKELYSSALKDNEALKRGCLMGITEVRGASIFSGLNNFRIFSVAHKTYSKYFGFSADEIK